MSGLADMIIARIEGERDAAIKRAEAAEKRVAELAAEDAIWQKHDLIAERAKLEMRVAELQALVDAAHALIADLPMALARVGERFDRHQSCLARLAEFTGPALANELASKEPR